MARDGDARARDADAVEPGPIGQDTPELAAAIERLETELAHVRGGGEAFWAGIRDLIDTRAASWRELAPTLFDQTVWGRIRWRRALGRPDRPRLADGFELTHMFHEIDGVAGPEGQAIPTGRWVRGAPARLWDGPEEPDHHSVGYRLQGRHPWMNAIGVSLRPGVAWSPRGAPWLASARRVHYPDSLQPLGLFRVNSSGITELDDIEVVRVFY